MAKQVINQVEDVIGVIGYIECVADAEDEFKRQVIRQFGNEFGEDINAHCIDPECFDDATRNAYQKYVLTADSDCESFSKRLQALIDAPPIHVSPR